MTRATVIVALWLLIVGSLGEAALANEQSPLRLLLLYFVASALTAAAVWLQLADDDAPRAEDDRRSRDVYD